MFLAASAQGTPFCSSRQAANSGRGLIRFPPTTWFNFSQRSVLGQPRSEGRTRLRMALLAWSPLGKQETIVLRPPAAMLLRKVLRRNLASKTEFRGSIAPPCFQFWWKGYPLLILTTRPSVPHPYSPTLGLQPHCGGKISFGDR